MTACTLKIARCFFPFNDLGFHVSHESLMFSAIVPLA